MYIDKFGRACTIDRQEANRYRNEDRSPKFVQGNAINYIKYIPHYFYDKPSRTYFLPPKLSKKDYKSYSQIEYNFTYELYDYQKQAVEYYTSNQYKSMLVKAGVWCGKTVIGAGVINVKKTPTLIMAPTQLICEWWYDTLKAMCNVEYMVASQIKTAAKDWTLPDVLIATRASITNVIDIINWYYDLLIFDEAHKLSENAKQIINKWEWWRIVWLSATPKRKDMNVEDMVDFFWWYIDLKIEALPVKVITYKYSHKYSIEDYMKACEWLNPECNESMRRLVNNNDHKIFCLRRDVVSPLYKKWIHRFILFVDRVDYAYKIKEYFPNAVIISWESDKQEVVDSIKDKDEYFIIAMSWCAGEWFNLPSIECAILFYSTEWDNSIEQLCWRARRYYGDKKVCYRVDVQEKSKVVDKRNRFNSSKRLKHYEEKWREVIPLESFLKNDTITLF